MEKVRRSQPCILINSCSELSRKQISKIKAKTIVIIVALLTPFIIIL